MKFRKKPIVINAIKFEGTLASYMDIRKEFGIDKTSAFNFSSGRFSIGTLEGIHEVQKDDWVIKGIKDEFYPCKPDIFEMTYERV